MALAIHAPSFHCTNCGTELKTAFTYQVLWSAPVLMATLAVTYLTVGWLRQWHQPNALIAGAIGGLSGGSFALAAKVALRGIKFKKWGE